MKFGKNFKKISALLLTLILVSLIISPVYGDGEADNPDAELDKHMIYIKSMIKTMESKYVDDIDLDELTEAAIRGMFDSLDEHSSYYNEEEFNELFENVSGDFDGIGVYIVEEDDFVTVVTPIQGSPADKAGLKAGDKLASVDGQYIEGYTTDQAAKLIKGPSGTAVRIGVIRKGYDSMLYFDITRETIKINPVSYEIKEGDIGYIQITQFNSHTVSNMKKALKEMDNKEITKLVIDLRNNPGGYLDEVVELLGYFITEGPVVHIKYADDEIETRESHLKKAKYDVAVLVNEGSASASEIFAGAIQDTGVGTIIGTTSYGKGTVQTIYPLYSLQGMSGMKITVAEYLTPKMRSIDGKGIIPDIVVENKPAEFEIDLSDIPKYSKKSKPELNSVSLDVLATEQILTILGYELEEPDGVMDQESLNAVKEFQKEQGLFAYGIVDYTTQDALVKALETHIIDNTKDMQLEKALEVLKK
ncbi:S41 family peptidase [Sporosalibacterium faouarense]|uniref:S41 family peptidase n=1 Tax=Sporosalibacterium faouarense TaxID=516123 RepID=UPI00192C8075|nr:S41 family peptidase [Sporosalibacterium faouarense]